MSVEHRGLVFQPNSTARFQPAAIAWEGKYKGRTSLVRRTRDSACVRCRFATCVRLPGAGNYKLEGFAYDGRRTTSDGSQMHLHSLRISTLGSVWTVCRASASVA